MTTEPECTRDTISRVLDAAACADEPADVSLGDLTAVRAAALFGIEARKRIAELERDLDTRKAMDEVFGSSNAKLCLEVRELKAERDAAIAAGNARAVEHLTKLLGWLRDERSGCRNADCHHCPGYKEVAALIEKHLAALRAPSPEKPAQTPCATPTTSTDRVQQLREGLRWYAPDGAGEDASLFWKQLDELCALASNPTLVRAPEPADFDSAEAWRRIALRLFVHYDGSQDANWINHIEAAVRIMRRRAPEPAGDGALRRLREQLKPWDFSSTNEDNAIGISTLFSMIDRLLAAQEPPADESDLVRTLRLDLDDARANRDKWKKEAAAARAETAAARAERDKAQFSARQFCGAHVGQKFDECPVCYGKKVRIERDAARAEARKLAIEELRGLMQFVREQSPPLECGNNSDHAYWNTLRGTLQDFARARIASLESPPKPEAEKVDDVVELRMCEVAFLVLRPNQIYRFTVDESCAKCVATRDGKEWPKEAACPACGVVGRHKCWMGGAKAVEREGDDKACREMREAAAAKARGDDVLRDFLATPIPDLVDPSLFPRYLRLMASAVKTLALAAKEQP